MIWLSPGLTAVVAAVLAAYAVPFYWLNLNVVRASREHEVQGRESAAAVSRLVAFLLDRSAPGGRRWADGRVLRGGLEALRDILLARRRVQRLQDVFFGVILVVVLLVFGVFIARDSASWSGLIAYLAALRFASTAMSTAARFVTATNRFLPQVRRYVEFPSGPRSVAAPRAAAAGQELELVAVDPKLPGTAASLRVVPGDRVLCAWAPPLSAVTLPAFLGALCGGDGRSHPGGVFFYGGNAPLPPVRLADMAGRADGAAGRAETLLEKLGLHDEVRGLPRGLHEVLTPEVAARLTPSLRYTLGALEGLLADWRLVVLGWPALDRLDAPFRRRLLDLLGDRIVIVVSPELTALQPEELPVTVVLDDAGVHGIGPATWHESVGALLPRAPRRAAVRGDGEDVDPVPEDVLEED